MSRLQVKVMMGWLARWQSKDEAGLTLIECLVAIIMIGLLVGLVTPALVISVATRINSQRIEQALAIAQAEVDQVRALVERGGTINADDLPPELTFSDYPGATIGGTGGVPLQELPALIPGPLGDGATGLVPTNAPYSTTSAFQARVVDIDGDGVDTDGDGVLDENMDLAIQTFRSSTPLAFSLGVRVYDIEAFDGSVTNLDASETATAGMTGGQAERSTLPLAAIYTTVARSDAATSLCSYVQYVRSTPTSLDPTVYNCD